MQNMEACILTELDQQGNEIFLRMSPKSIIFKDAI